MNLAGLSDEEVALALKDGHEEAFEELVRRFQGRVYAVAYRMTCNREDALDVTQETLLKAYRKIGTWQPTRGFMPWLMRMTTNQSIDHLRRQKRHRHEPYDEAVKQDGEDGAIQSLTQDTARHARAREIDRRLQAALLGLSPTQRAVFAMRHFEGLALADIAAALGCTTGSVKVHLFRSLKKLQRELADLYY